MAASTAATTDRVHDLLRQHGAEATSFQVLEPGYHYWFDGDDACIAYTDTGQAWVAVGAPVAAPHDQAGTARRFCAAAAAHGREARFFAVDEAFTDRADLRRTHIGEQPLWDPLEWEGIVASSRSLREQLRRARAKGVALRVVPAAEIADPASRVRRGVEQLIERWLASHKMSEMKFMVLVHPFSYPEERRYVVAELEGEIVGFAAAVPVYARSGWFVEDVIRDPNAPNGTAELLIDAMMRQFAAEGSRYATLGLAPLAGDVNSVLRLTRDYTAHLYNFGGVRAFKEKLKPHEWEPIYVAYAHGQLGIMAMRDVLAAFAPGGLTRFGLDSLVHQRTLATFLLALLLVPWTVALALAETEHWFPNASIQAGWALFDALLIVLLFALVQRWRPPLATLLVGLTTLDAILTFWQVMVFNIDTATRPWHWLVITAAISGPLLASTFFWATRRVAVRNKLPIARETLHAT